MDLGLQNILKIEYWLGLIFPIILIILAIENFEFSKKIIFYIIDGIISIILFILGTIFGLLSPK